MEEGADGLNRPARVAFLTTAELDGFVTYDHQVVEPAASRGIEIVFVPWRDPAHWCTFDAVVVRSPWDYQHDLERFLAVLSEIEARGVPLWNPASSARWNCDKGYLGDLERRRLPVIPTEYLEAGRGGGLRERAAGLVARARDTGVCAPGDPPRVVVKPRVGASGEDSWALSLDRDDGWREANRVLGGRQVLIQPFLSSVLDDGEYSLIVVDGEPSHVIRKIPAPGEYRSQEEWGGEIMAVSAPGFEAWAMEVVSAVPEARDLLYLRVDGLRDAAGQWRLGELELVEPSLYFPFGPQSAERFADALVRRLQEGAEGFSAPDR